MTMDDALFARVVREALEPGARVDLAALVQRVLTVAELRALAQRFGLNPKGFRVERAPAAKLVSLLLDPKRPDVLEETCRSFVKRLSAGAAEAAAEPVDAQRATGDASALLTLRAAELTEARTELQRLRTQASQWRERESSLLQRALDAEGRAARARSDLDQAAQRTARRQQDRVPVRPEELERRLRDAEKEREDAARTETELRYLLALRQARIRELDDRVQELLLLVPKGKHKREERIEAPALADQFRIPYFLPSFYKSLVDKDRRAVQQAVQAVLLFCTEGPSYPGLEVKPIEGQDTWSLRASLKLRVYFRFRQDGDVDFLEVADREDQHTALRRLKER